MIRIRPMALPPRTNQRPRALAPSRIVARRPSPVFHLTEVKAPACSIPLTFGSKIKEQPKLADAQLAASPEARARPPGLQ